MTEGNDANILGLIAQVNIRRDDGSGVFEETDPIVASVTSFSLTNGRLSISFADGDPNVTVSPGSSQRYFVGVRPTLSAVAASWKPSRLRTTATSVASWPAR